MDTAIPSGDGITLAARFWAGDHARGVLVIAHGLGEHGGCYESLAEELTAQPGLVDVLAVDFRGHGRSPGRRGVVRRYDELVADLESAVVWASRHRPDRPIFVLGHSNGGQVALHLALKTPSGLSGLILSNPSLALAVAVPRWKLAVGRLLDRLAPTVTLSAGLDPSQMTRDESSWGQRAADDLRHNRVSAPLYFGMLSGGAAVAERAGELDVPTLMILGDDDPIVDRDAAIRFFHRMTTRAKTMLRFPGMRHEPLNEIGCEAVRDAITTWLSDRLAALPPSCPSNAPSGTAREAQGRTN